MIVALLLESRWAGRLDVLLLLLSLLAAAAAAQVCVSVEFLHTPKFTGEPMDWLRKHP